MSAPYSVPKHEVRAEVRLSAEAPAVVRLFLGEQAETHAGPERPSDLLNGEQPFLPARDGEQHLMLLNRDAVMVLTVAAERESADDDAPEEDLVAEQASIAHVEVTLDDGSTIRGVVRYLMPEARRRLQDFLNGGERFLALREEGATHLINKRRIACIRPL